MPPGGLRHNAVGRPPHADEPEQNHLQSSAGPRLEQPSQLPRAGRLTKVLKHAECQPASFRFLAHASCGRDRNGQRLLRHQMLAMSKGDGGHLMVQGMRGDIIDRIDGTGGDHFGVVGEHLDVDVVLKVGQIFFGDRQRIAGDVADRFSLRGIAASAQIHSRVAFLARAKRGDSKVIDARLAQQPIAAQMGGQNTPAPHNAYPNHCSPFHWDGRDRTPWISNAQALQQIADTLPYTQKSV